jgi:hypothetical protein
VREISGQTSGGFCAQNSLNAEYGLGDAQLIDSIRIHWPSGIQWDTVNVTPNQFLIITEKSALQNLAVPLIDYPQEFFLKQNYPNPFNPETVIEYQLLYTEDVKLNIYNSNGIHIKTLVDAKKTAGLHKVIWDGKNQRDYDVSSGIYYYKLMTARGFQQVKKAILIR